MTKGFSVCASSDQNNLLKHVQSHTIFSFFFLFSLHTGPALSAYLISTCATLCMSSSGLAWDKKPVYSQSTYKGYIISTIHLPSYAHPLFFLCQAITQDCHNRKEMWVPFLNPTLFCIRKKKEKDLPWSTLPPVWQPGCLGHPCDPET